MKEKALLLANTLLFLLLALVLGSLQTSFWLQLFGYFPAPALWMPVLIYLAIYRGTIATIILSHLVSIVLGSLTTMPTGLIMLSCLGVALGVQFLKTRIYWARPTYFMMVCGLGTLAFHLLHFIASWLLSESPMTRPALTDWIIQTMLTPLVAPFLFFVFRWIDRITEREEPPEITGTISV